MGGIKWIKFYVNTFDNRKIRFIDTLPEADAILVIWFKLMALAGMINDGGEVYLTREIPYTDELLSAQFNRPLNTVRLALRTLEQLDMIEIIDDVLQLRNWQEYQGSEQIERVRELGKIRQKAFRDRKRIAAKNDSNATRNVTRNDDVTHGVTSRKRKCNAVEEESEKEEDKEHSLRECNAPARANVYGVYQNVTLTDDALAALRMDFPTEWQRMIDNLSTYMQTHGTEYADHAAVMRKWAAEDAKKKKAKPGSGGNAFGYEAQREYSSEEMDELELKMRLRRTGDQEGGGND